MARGGSAAVRLPRKALKDRQGEPGGLPGAGLGGAEEVTAGQDDGDGLGLDRGGPGIALLGYGARERGRKPEAFERGANDESPGVGLEKGGPFDRFRLTLLGFVIRSPGWTE
jgi:hypothetical protein